MNDSTRKVLSDLKELMETRKKMQAEGLLDEKELRRKIVMEEQMKWEISEMMKIAHEKVLKKRAADEKAIGQMAYKLERKMREAKRLREEEEYRRLVEERYAERMRKEEEERRSKTEQNVDALKMDELTL